MFSLILFFRYHCVELFISSSMYRSKNVFNLFILIMISILNNLKFNFESVFFFLDFADNAPQ